MKQYSQQFIKLLLKIGALKIDVNKGFVWTSGWNSPIYCDNRKILFNPKEREEIAEMMVVLAKRMLTGRSNIVIAGVATGAIGLGLLIAESLNLPFVYVRPKPKEHGMGNQIEGGELNANHQVLVIEDLISTGKSSLQAVDAIRATGATVVGMCGLFTYGFQVAKDAFEGSGVELVTLGDYDALSQEAEAQGLLLPEHKELFAEWRLSPGDWKPLSKRESLVH